MSKKKSEPMPMSTEMKSSITRAVNRIAALEAAEKTIRGKKTELRELVRRSLATHGQEAFETPKATAKLVTGTKRSVTALTWRRVAELSTKMMARVLSFKAAQAEKAKDDAGVAAVLSTLEETETTSLVIESVVSARVDVETSADPNRAHA